MTLSPTEPPGRSSRKALRYATEIARLRREGYTCEAIRRALLDAGLAVSLATVKREASRRSKPSTSTFSAAQPTPTLPAREIAGAPSSATLAFANDPRSSKEIAAAFVAGRFTNPLLRSRIAP